jgi:hypothetical protein
MPVHASILFVDCICKNMLLENRLKWEKTLSFSLLFLPSLSWAGVSPSGGPSGASPLLPRPPRASPSPGPAGRLAAQPSPPRAAHLPHPGLASRRAAQLPQRPPLPAFPARSARAVTTVAATPSGPHLYAPTAPFILPTTHVPFPSLLHLAHVDQSCPRRCSPAPPSPLPW